MPQKQFIFLDDRTSRQSENIVTKGQFFHPEPRARWLLRDPRLPDQLRHRRSHFRLLPHPHNLFPENRSLFTANLPSSGSRFCRKLTFNVY